MMLIFHRLIVILTTVGILHAQEKHVTLNLFDSGGWGRSDQLFGKPSLSVSVDFLKMNCFSWENRAKTTRKRLKALAENMFTLFKNKPLFSLLDFEASSGVRNPRMTVQDLKILALKKEQMKMVNSVCLITGVDSLPSGSDTEGGGWLNGEFMEKREKLLPGQKLGNLPLFPVHYLDKDKTDPYLPGTGFLISDQYVVTAAHVIHRLTEEQRKNELRFVFGCVAEDGKALSGEIKYGEIRKYASVVAKGSPYMPGGEQDWVIIKLDKPLKNSGFELFDNYHFTEKSDVYMLGYPRGGAMVKHDRGVILGKDVKMAKYYGSRYRVSLSAFKGNSGSPVIDKATNKVIGLFVASPPDFEGGRHHTITNVKSVKSMFIGAGQIREWILKNG